MDLRDGPNIDPLLAKRAPLLAVVVAALGTLDTGDIRRGVFPWAMALAALGLVVCCLGLLRAHRGAANRWLVIGAWWTAAAFAGIAFFFVSVATGGLLRIEEEDAGLLAWPPFLAMVSSVISMLPATTILGVGVIRAGRLPRYAGAALFVAALVIPSIGIYGGTG